MWDPGIVVVVDVYGKTKLSPRLDTRSVSIRSESFRKPKPHSFTFYKTRILEQVLRQISKWGREVTPVSATFEYSEPFISFHTKHDEK